MSDSLLTSYEELPYDSKPWYAMHIDTLATLATLFGMNPAPVTDCRVLEIGCGTGANLLPMAASLPGSRFVGIDLSPRQIAMGQAVIDTLELPNIELKPLNLMDVDEHFGMFDYIICHGVYSWVPPQVQERILTICKRRLASHGVAYVSYNTYPGWHLRSVTRDLMRFHARSFAEPRVQVRQARAFLNFLSRSMPAPDSAYARLLKEEADDLPTRADSYIFHEHLEAENRPLYFTEFVERAAASGLQYLAEAWQSTHLDNYAPEVQQTLQQLASNLIQWEQYVDFLRNRAFRCTLLCHAEIPLIRDIPLEKLAEFRIRARTQPVAAGPDVHSASKEVFQTIEGDRTISTNIPVVKAALVCLADAWPTSLTLDELWTGVQARLDPLTQPSPPGGEGRVRGNPLAHRDGRVVAEHLLRLYLANLLGLHVMPASFVPVATERPVASPLARLQAARGADVASLLHRVVEMPEFDRVVLRHLDGSRDRAALLDILEAAISPTSPNLGEGKGVGKRLAIPGDDPLLHPRGWSRRDLAGALEVSLQRLARFALLIR